MWIEYGGAILSSSCGVLSGHMLGRSRYLADLVRYAALLSAALLVASPIAGASTARRAIAVVNSQRAANGIPAGVTENQAWSHDCALHDRCMATNSSLAPSEDHAHRKSVQSRRCTMGRGAGQPPYLRA
jgi:hypothetical protein